MQIHHYVFQTHRIVPVPKTGEIFQLTIQAMIADTPGALHVSDDRNQIEHGIALGNTLSVLQKSWLTVSSKKCKIKKFSIKFFRYKFSASSLVPTPEKTKALQDTTEPHNPTKLYSFLNMVRYSAKFIQNFAAINQLLCKLTQIDTA